MSILHFKAMYGIKEAGHNIRTFIYDNMEEFWNILKPILPFLLICALLDFIITQITMPIDPQTGQKQQFFLFSIIANYFMACLAISWHRVVLNGPDNYTPMNPLKPDHNGLAYILTFLGFFVMGGIIGVCAGIIFGLLGIPQIIVMIIVGLGTLNIFTRLCFCLPGLATGNHVTISEAFKLGKGLVLRVLLTPIVAGWKIFLMMACYPIVAILFIMMLATMTGGFFGTGLANNILNFALSLPILLYFVPMLTLFGVTALSNYYQFAIQNPNFKDGDIGTDIEKAEDETVDKILDDPYGHDLDDNKNDNNKE